MRPHVKGQGSLGNELHDHEVTIGKITNYFPMIQCLYLRRYIETAFRREDGFTEGGPNLNTVDVRFIELATPAKIYKFRSKLEDRLQIPKRGLSCN